MTALTPQLPTSPFGLSEAEAARRLAAEGPNALPDAGAKSPGRLLFDLVREPMVFLLVGCGLVYLVLGDQQEASMLLGFLGLILAITYFQERKTENALRALRDLSSPRALVLRDGRQRRIPGIEVVSGDMVMVSEGDRIPADGNIVAATNFAVNEAMLTGESVPVPKMPEGTGEDATAGQVFAGTTAVKGSATLLITATGMHTQLGKIGGMLATIEARPTRLAGEIAAMVKILAIIAAALCLVVVAGYALNRHDLLGGILAGLTLAMAIMPNELPAVLTIFMALGAWRMAKQRVLTRRTSALEALGTATVLCVDKTGTLTYNRMAVRWLHAGGQSIDLTATNVGGLPEVFHQVIEYGILAGDTRSFDPVEQAISSVGNTFLSGTEHLHDDWALVRQYPLSPELLALSHVWQARGERARPIAAKGAPEAIVDLCHLPADERAAVGATVAAMASSGLRLLGVAKARVPDGPLPDIQHDFDFEFVGLIGLADPLRAEVPAAIQECQAAGVRVIMITGDHPATASSIAAQAGLQGAQAVLTGADLAAMTPEELSQRLRSVNVCARMAPAHKGRLIEALQAQGHVVAMTGDGVNDAPAIKNADIGIAMGQRGTDVAREAADLVLLDDDFAAIVGAIRMGRRIYANLQRAMSYLLAIHVPIAGLSVLPAVFDLPLILLPVHVAFLHLIIEPVCSVAFEADAVAADSMRQPPRPAAAPLFAWTLLGPTLARGLSVLVVLMATYIFALRLGSDAAEARALVFATLVIANLGLVAATRQRVRTPWSWNPRRIGRPWWLLTGGSVALLALALYQPTLRTLFRFAPLHLRDLGLCLLGGLGGSLWLSIPARRRRAKAA